MEIKSKNDKKIINRIKKLIIDYSKDNKNKHFFFVIVHPFYKSTYYNLFYMDYSVIKKTDDAGTCENKI